MTAFFDRPRLLLALASLLWAGNVVIGRYVVDSVSPVLLAQIRWTGAFLILLCITGAKLPYYIPEARRHARLILAASLTGISAYNAMSYIALEMTSATNVLIFQSFGPIGVALWAYWLYREPLTWKQGLGILLSLTGVLCLVSKGTIETFLTLTFNKGDIWAIAAIFLYGLYTALMKRRPAMPPIVFLTFLVGVGQACLVPVSFIDWQIDPRLSLSPSALLAYGYVVFFPSVLAFLFFNRGVELIGPNSASPYLHLIPAFGIGLAVLFLGERLSLYHAIGFMLILTGVFTASYRKRQSLVNQNDKNSL